MKHTVRNHLTKGLHINFGFLANGFLDISPSIPGWGLGTMNTEKSFEIRFYKYNPILKV